MTELLAKGSRKDNLNENLAFDTMNIQTRLKRAFWKATRQTKLKVIDAQLEDRYTIFDEEAEEARECTPENPCRFCRGEPQIQHARNTHYAGTKINAH